MPTGSYSVSLSLPSGNTSGRQPETEYNNDALDGAMSSLRVLGWCLGSGGPWSTGKLCGRRQLWRTHYVIWGHRFSVVENYQIEQVAQTRLFPISYREKTRVKMKHMEFGSRGTL